LAASALAIAALVAFSAAAAPTLRQGDVLISDTSNDRILYVNPTNGPVRVFSPRNDEANLLDAPAGIDIDPTGAVFVLSSGTGRLVRIDPTTGAQTIVNAFDTTTFYGPIALGAQAAGLDVSGIWGTNDPPDL
jgi:DNA-binding beta-propeller fold protein YncE